MPSWKICTKNLWALFRTKKVFYEIKLSGICRGMDMKNLQLGMFFFVRIFLYRVWLDFPDENCIALDLKPTPTK